MNTRTHVMIMREFLETTNEMLSKRNDADALVVGTAHRQMLMEEYQSLTEMELSPTPHEMVEIRRIASEVLEKDKIINASLETYHKESKQELADSNQRQKVMTGYMSQNISSGSYMDYKK